MSIDKKYRKEIKMLEAQRKLFKNKVVIQKNDFIKGNTSIFSVNDLKIFKLIISKVKSQETLFENYYEISTDEVKALNINEVHLHRETMQSLKKLANIYVNIETEDGGYREVGLIRNDFKFPKYSKNILITFNDDMREYLLDIKGNYTKYSLIDIVNFKLKHTLKLYEFLKSVSLNVMKVKVETLKRELDLIGKYEKFFEFKRKVLEPSVEEINEKTETLNVTYTLVRDGREVSMIVFHIQRFDANDIIKQDVIIEHEYKYLIGEECIYFEKYYKLEDLDLKKNIIFLKEVYTDNRSNIIVSNKEQLESTLKSLFKDKFNNTIIEVKVEEKDELKELSKMKDFKKFRQKVIEEFKNKPLMNNAPNFLEDTIISINDQGLLENSFTNKIITKEESYEIWKYLFKNRDKVGVVEKTNPIKKFINIVINIEKKNMFDKKEQLQYKILEIREEEKDRYRLILQDIHDLYCIEESKTLLSYEQLSAYIKKNEIEIL